MDSKANTQEDTRLMWESYVNRDSGVAETKTAPDGHYYTKSGNLVKGRLSTTAKDRGARLSDPKDKQRSKTPAVTQYNAEDLDDHNQYMMDRDLLQPLHAAAMETGAKDLNDWMIQQIKSQGDNWVQWFIDTVITSNNQ